MSASDYGTRRDDPGGPPFLYEAPQGWPQPDYRWMADNQLIGLFAPEGFDAPGLSDEDQPWFVNRPVFDKWVIHARKVIRRQLCLHALWLALATVIFLVGISSESVLGVISGTANGICALYFLVRYIAADLDPWNVTVNEIRRWSLARTPPEPVASRVKPF